MTNPNDYQVGGTHYSNKTGIQHWDFVAVALRGRYFEGQVTRYISRHAKKNGAEDVNKALHYIEKMEQLHAAGYLQPIRNTTGPLPMDVLDTFANFTELMHEHSDEYHVCEIMMRWSEAKHLMTAKVLTRAILLQKYTEQHVKPPHNDPSALSNHAKQGEEAGPGYVNQG